MKRKNRSANIKKLLTARGIYDNTPDSNIERLNKDIVDLSVSNKSNIVKLIEQKKREKKDKPIRTSLLLCKRR